MSISITLLVIHTHEYIYHYTNDTKNYLKLPTFSKLANILPVFEHVASSQTNNYWPASISPIISKNFDQPASPPLSPKEVTIDQLVSRPLSPKEVAIEQPVSRPLTPNEVAIDQPASRPLSPKELLTSQYLARYLRKR